MVPDIDDIRERALDAGPGEPPSFPMEVRVSVARCARVSYLTHEGKKDVEEDLRLYEKLITSEPKHLSPLEHAARVVDMPLRYEHIWRSNGECAICGQHQNADDAPGPCSPIFVGNFRAPWVQHRKDIAGEDGRLPRG